MSATNPFQATVEINLPDGTEGENGFVHVPKGKRLEIEYASGEAFLPTGQKALFSVITSLAGERTGISHYLDSDALGNFGAPDYFRAGQVVRLYADPGTVVMLRIDRDRPTGAGLARMSISGQLVAVP
ncbi:MAG TPA: hypothetical protein VHG32_20355 [Thermoanaerobaculia bacterium]|jgi:hypothetical protein|nr:hypothetical protein [Thermoanaerobaculia bacterium]